MYVENLDDKKSKGTHWVSFFIDRNTAVDVDSFGNEYIPQEVLNKIKYKSITLNTFRIQDNESIMCGFYCIAFIEYMLAGKTLLEIIPSFFLRMTIKRMTWWYISIWKINMIEEASLEFWLRKIGETRNYLLEEIKHNYLMSEKYKKTCKYLNYVENVLILASAVTGCVSISAFASIVAIPACVTNKNKNFCNHCRNQKV